MPNNLRLLFLVLGIFALCAEPSNALEVFGKGEASRNYLASDEYTLTVSGTAGFAFTLFSSVRFEARYTNMSSLQNKMEIVASQVVGTLNNVLTQTDSFSAGLDIDFFGDKASVQPYIYVGVGYIMTTRSYYFTQAGADTSTYYKDPVQDGISGNLGLGFRIRIAKHLALELELFGYGMNITQPNPLINLYGTAGLRIFI